MPSRWVLVGVVVGSVACGGGADERPDAPVALDAPLADAVPGDAPACTDTTSDPANCGACGRVCEGACTDGQCAPLRLESGDVTGLFDVVADDAFVYFLGIDAGDVARLYRSALGASGAPTILASFNIPQDRPQLGFDGTYLYTVASRRLSANNYENRIVKTHKAGTSSVALVTTTEPIAPGLTLANGQLYFAIDVAFQNTVGELRRVPADGGAVTSVLRDEEVGRVAHLRADDTNLYWLRKDNLGVTDGFANKMPLAVPVTLPVGKSEGWSFDLDATHLYGHDYPDQVQPGTVLRSAKAGTTTEVLPPVDVITAPAVDDAHVYASVLRRDTSGTVVGNDLVAYTKDGTAVAVLMSTQPQVVDGCPFIENATRVKVFGDHVYLITVPSCGFLTQPPRLYRVPRL